MTQKKSNTNVAKIARYARNNVIEASYCIVSF